ncbi:MAG: serine/threonine-protein kinase [Gemmataceae bacterium]
MKSRPPSDQESTIRFILNLLRSDLTPEQVQLWWERNRKADESFCDTLTRKEIFRAHAERSIELVEKGFLQNIDSSLIFQPQGAEKLKALVLELFMNNSTVIDTENVITVMRPSQQSLVQSESTEFKFPQIGDVLGRCLLTGIIGRGGYGTVFSALHQTLNLPVAVKVLFSPENGMTQSTRDSLRREARLLARIAHPNIVRVMDFDDSTIPYFVMEYVEGPSLADLINQTGGLRADKATKIMIAVVEALAAGWSHEIVHRDIKPGNILMTKSGEVKLADLGLAFVRGSDDESNGNGNPIGTCAYMSPEQIRNDKDVDFRADIYALGCTFYHALTGSMPFTGKHPREVILKHLQTPAVPLVKSHPNLVSPELSALIEKMLAKEPENRHASYADLLVDMNELASTTNRAPHDSSGDDQSSSSKKSSGKSQFSQLKSNLTDWLFRRPSD